MDSDPRQLVNGTKTGSGTGTKTGTNLLRTKSSKEEGGVSRHPLTVNWPDTRRAIRERTFRQAPLGKRESDGTLV